MLIQRVLHRNYSILQNNSQIGRQDNDKSKLYTIASFLSLALRTSSLQLRTLNITASFVFVEQPAASYILANSLSHRLFRPAIASLRSLICVQSASLTTATGSMHPSEPDGVGLERDRRLGGSTASNPLQDYVFPRKKLKVPKDLSKQPIALIACGSFSPVRRPYEGRSDLSDKHQGHLSAFAHV